MDLAKQRIQDILADYDGLPTLHQIEQTREEELTTLIAQQITDTIVNYTMTTTGKILNGQYKHICSNQCRNFS